MDGGFLPEFDTGPPAGRAPPQPAQAWTAGPPSAATAARAPAWEQEEQEHPPEAGCSRCSSLSYSEEFYKAFGVVLCNSCKRGEQLISKSNAKMRYSLTDTDLRGLGSIRRANAHNRNWQPMSLYLQSQVEAAARRKFGSLEELEERQRQALDNKLEARMRRREADKDKERREEEKLRRIKQRIQEENERLAGEASGLEGQPGEAQMLAGEEEVEEI